MPGAVAIPAWQAGHRVTWRVIAGLGVARRAWQETASHGLFRLGSRGGAWLGTVNQFLVWQARLGVFR